MYIHLCNYTILDISKFSSWVFNFYQKKFAPQKFFEEQKDWQLYGEKTPLKVRPLCGVNRAGHRIYRDVVGASGIQGCSNVSPVKYRHCPRQGDRQIDDGVDDHCPAWGIGAAKRRHGKR
jgi:hypothetical protein